MRKLLLILLFVPIFGFTVNDYLTPASAGFRGVGAGWRVPLRVVTPSDAFQTSIGTPEYIGITYPVIIGYHGAGEKTSSYPNMATIGTGDLNKLWNTSLPSLLRYENSSLTDKRWSAPGRTKTTQFYYVFPQTWQGATLTYPVVTYETLRWIKANMPYADLTRIYVVGLSLGGGHVLSILQIPELSDQIAAGSASCPGYMTVPVVVPGTPLYNFQAFMDWGGGLLLAHSQNDSTTDKNPVTRSGSYYSDRFVDSANKYTGITTLIYKHWTTGGHGVWDRSQDPANKDVVYPQVNAQNAGFDVPIQSFFLQFSRAAPVKVR